MKASPALLVFSDLDGTLLDHASYSWAAAAPALARLHDMGAGLVLATSKTGAEVAPLREDMGCADWPAIVENGCGLLEPGEAGTGEDSIYRRIRKTLADLPPGFRGFGDMSADEISARTGLEPGAAQRAKLRRFSEPGLWTGPKEAFAAFEHAAAQAGLSLQSGGRFRTLSFGGTKAARMQELIKRFAPGRTVALGDAPNDLAMLSRADHGVIVANSASPDLPALDGETTGHITRTTHEGPEGWAEAVVALLDQFFPARRSASDG